MRVRGSQKLNSIPRTMAMQEGCPLQKNAGCALALCGWACPPQRTCSGLSRSAERRLPPLASPQQSGMPPYPSTRLSSSPAHLAVERCLGKGPSSAGHPPQGTVPCQEPLATTSYITPVS